ncbi:uncharacterized protein LOC143145457 [Ptiloglossa arizonensis]|uniref:uncharacterized protein LOC143145457 n=1 Tax=Ptiloglossa arizonensis TaxID=3350558 RepID=UPI003FA0DCE1
MSLFRFHSRRLTRIAVLFALARSASFIVVSQDSYRDESGSSDRRSIIEKLASYRDRRERFSEAGSCIETFLDFHLNDPSRSIFIEVDDEREIETIAQPLVRRLRGRYAFFTHQTSVDFEIPGDTASSAIVLMSNGDSFKHDFYVIDPCDRGCLFVAILTTEFENEESFLAEAIVLIEAMWTRRLSIFVVLARVRDSVLAAGSVAFEPYEICTLSSSTVLNRCSIRDSSWNNTIEIGPPDLNGCLLKVAYFEQPPYTITVNGSAESNGFEGYLTREITSDMRIEWEMVTWSDNTSYSEQVKMLLYEETRADLVIGRVLQQAQEDIDYSTTYDMLKVVWVVPKTSKVSLEGLILPFQPYVWAAIAGSLLLGSLIKCFLVRDVSWLDIFALIIGIPLPRQPTRPSRRIHFITWSIAGLFLTQIYVDSLSGQLIDESILKIETTKDLLSSSFKLGGTTAFASLFDKFEESDEMVTQVRRKFVVFDLERYVDLFEDLLDGRNATFALVTVLNSSRSDAIETAYAYTMTTDVICSFPLGLATWKGFPWLRVMDDRIHDLIGNGIFDFMTELALANETRKRMFAIANDQEYKSELHLQQFVPAFLLMVIGFSTGFVSLLLEIALYPCKFFQSNARTPKL